MIPFGDCANARLEYKYKGVVAKKYDCEFKSDGYNRHLDCILLTIGKNQYECEQLFIDGVEIFTEEMEE